MPRSFSTRATRSESPPISHLIARALDNPNLVSLAAGFVDAETLPNEFVQTAFAALAECQVSRDSLLQYGSTIGHQPLRELIRERLLEDDQFAVDIDVKQVVLTAGSNQLLHLVSECLLDEGDIVLCSAPTYFVYLGQLKNFGARAIGVTVDDQGMRPDALHDQLERLSHAGLRSRVKILYLVTFCDNPRGVTMPASRRRDLMQVLQEAGYLASIRIIDDAAYRALDLSTPPVPQSLLAHDPTHAHTIVAGTFSKSFSPGIRVGWGILPKDLVDPVLNLKGSIDFGSPSLNQHLMHRVLQLGCFDDQVQRLRDTYQSKLAATLAAVKASLGKIPGIRWVKPDGGLYVWVELPPDIDTGPDGPLLTKAIDRGVLYVPGEYCFADEGPRQTNAMRLSFGIPSIDQIEHGVHALAQAITDTMSATTG